jgi:hypothetical protein
MFISIAAGLYCFYYLLTIDGWHFLDNVDLIIHEAGHVIFMPFGKFMYIAGGSLLQLIIPALFISYFFFQRQLYSSYILLYWLGINFFNVARYASDAIVMQLPLLGGDSSGHDWHNLLTMTSGLQHTKGISTFIYALGVICVCAGLAFSFNQAYQGENNE